MTNTRKILIVVLPMFFIQLQAQFKSKIPLDPAIRYGVLDNGMTYLIKHNSEPEQRVSFYFAQNVGAILEEDHQNGLAHFLEHMAFNGTKHFEGKGIFNFLEPHGVKFGNNINAFTALDETVYNISNVPTQNQGLLDSCLLVLHDWSGYLSLTDEEIDAERGVIREEWRTRRNSGKRLRDQQAPYIYANSKYTKRDIIGSLDVINNFTYKDLRDYYNMWYRPDLQAVIIVGDINVNKMERKIKEIFSDIPLKDNLPGREYVGVPDHQEILYVVAKDKEAPSQSITWLMKTDAKKVITEDVLRKELIINLFQSMFNKRCMEFVQDPGSPVLEMSVQKGELTRLKKYFALGVSPKTGREKETFELILTELQRVKKHGFTMTELERTKKSFLRSYENLSQEEEEITNDEWARQLYEYYLKSNPVMSVEEEVKFGITQIYSIRLDEVNKVVDNYLKRDNSVLILSGPDKEKVYYPTKEELLSISEEVKKKKLEAYVDEAISGPLMSNALEDVQLIGEVKIEGTDAIGYQLNSGATFVLLPTDHNKDQILFSTFSFGGMTRVDDKDLVSARVVNALSDASGVGAYTALQLQKILSGQIVGLQVGLSETSETVVGEASPKDFETLLQLIYLTFENPHFDKEVFETVVERWRTNLENQKDDPRIAFADSVDMMVSNYHPRASKLLLNEEFLENIDFDRATEIYKERFSDASDFLFFFVGNIDVKEHLPLIARYIGNITSTKKNETIRNHNVLPPKGNTVLVFEKKMEVPKSSVFYGVFGKTSFSSENDILLDFVKELLEKRYLESIREKEGGTYGVQVSSSLEKHPEERFSVNMVFDCDPEKQEHLRGIMKQELNDFLENGPNEEDLHKIKKNFIKNRKEMDDKNSFWINALALNLIYQVEITSLEEYNAYIESVTKEKVHEFAKQLFKDTDTVEIVMNPK